MKEQRRQGKNVVYLSVNQDLMYVCQNDDKSWRECTANDKKKSILLTVRSFQAFQGLDDKNVSLEVWIKSEENKPYSKSQIDLYINGQKKIKTPPHFENDDEEEEQQSLSAILVAQIDNTYHDEDTDTDKDKNKDIAAFEKTAAIESIFNIVNQLEPAAKAAFYKAIQKHIYNDDDDDDNSVKNIVTAYDSLADVERRKQLLNMDTPTDLKKARAEETTEEKTAKSAVKKLQKTESAIQQAIIREKLGDKAAWKNIINAIPVDPINGNNIFAQPVSTVETDYPRHEDLRQAMSRDICHYRYVAPKGSGGAQESGPQGGWYIGCYQTPDGRIHTQRVMMKREKKFHKNIIESLCGRLKTELVNIDQDYAAATYLVRDPTTKATGENTYAVSIAFDGFTEAHKLAGVETRPKAAGSKQSFGDAKKIFDKIQKLQDTPENYTGFEEALLGGWWTRDNDVHTANIGANTQLKRFLNIDHAGGMRKLEPKAHPNRHGPWENLKLVARGEATPHAPEYPSALRNSQRMADVIKRCTNRMTFAKITAIVDEEISKAAENFKDDPKEFRKFNERIGIKSTLPHDTEIAKYAQEAKEFLHEMMYARLINMRQYGNEIELSLCFEYSKEERKFVLRHPEKLKQFIRENPNYCLHHKHHFRGQSHGENRSAAYHYFHNKFGTGAELEALLKEKTKEVLNEKDTVGVTPFLTNDIVGESAISVPQRAQNYITRLLLIKQILEDGKITIDLDDDKEKESNLFNENPFKDKIDELIHFLASYSTDLAQQPGAKRQHLIQICDDAYTTIQRVYETLGFEKNYKDNVALSAKIKIYDILHDLQEKGSGPALMKEFNSCNKKNNGQIKELLDKHFKSFSIETSAFTATLHEAAERIDTLATNIHYNKQRRANRMVIEKKRQSLEKIVKSLVALAQEEQRNQEKNAVDANAENAAEDAAAEDAAAGEKTIAMHTLVTKTTKNKLNSEQFNNIGEKREYLAEATPLKYSEEKTFLKQAAEHFNTDEQLAQNVVPESKIQVRAEKQQSKLGEAATENKAILLENPMATREGKAGAVIIKENSTTTMVDFEDPKHSFKKLLADILATELSHYFSADDPDTLRKHAENYINALQNRFPPELVTKENLQRDLIAPIKKDKAIHSHAVTKFFSTTSSIADSVYNKFQKKFQDEIAWKPEYITWAYIWMQTLKAEGHKAENMYIENTHGNAEFARLFLILVCAEAGGEHYQHRANLTRYNFNVTRDDILRMRDIIHNPANSLHAKVMNNKIINFQQIEREFEQKASALVAPEELAVLIDDIDNYLYPPKHAENENNNDANAQNENEDEDEDENVDVDEDEDEDENENVDERLQQEKQQLQQYSERLEKLDPQGKYIQLYSNISAQLTRRINEIDARLKVISSNVVQRTESYHNNNSNA